MTKSWAVAAWSLLAVTPTLLLGLFLGNLIPDSTWGSPSFHLYIVSFASLLALILTVLMSVAAGQLRDPRVIFLSLAFMGITGVFLTHGLTTPGELVPINPWVAISSPFALFVGAIFLALATVQWSPAVTERIVNRQKTILFLFGGFLVLYGAVAIGTSLTTTTTSGGGIVMDDDAMYGMSMDMPAEIKTPFIGLFRFLEQPLVSHTLSVITLLLLLYVIHHFLRIYASSRSPLAAGFFFSALLTFQSEISVMTTSMWHLSWWEYHVVMVLALGIAIAGIVREYVQTPSLQGVVGGLLLRDTISQLQRGYTEVIVALVEAVEAKDPYTRGHTQRVAELAVLIAQDLGLHGERLKTLNQAAMLHDIGKISVPDAILNKPGRLTAEEFEFVKEHPVRGHRIIQNVRSLRQEIAGVRHHHERLDGSGYPDGLKGDEIPLDARIIAVADVFDALTSARPYRGPWSSEHAFQILDQEAGLTLDADCVQALHRVLPIWAGQADLVPDEPVAPA
ncbi:MAG TPA: HD-GYP domain-containing protein, partial [Nitrolancea sp.]|nr:HD-GYP domain-containing protein [Nitrolancea sp.]